MGGFLTTLKKLFFDDGVVRGDTKWRSSRTQNIRIVKGTRVHTSKSEFLELLSI